MKLSHLFILPLMGFSLTLSAQFSIKGSLENYANQPILIKIYDQGSERLLSKVKTNEKGYFEYQVPMAYTGVINLDLTKGKFKLVADNSDLAFSTDVQKSNDKIRYPGGINKKIQEYYNYQDKMGLKDFTYPQILEMYNPEDTFYKALTQEMERLGQMEQVEIADEEIRYYLTVKDELYKYSKGKTNPEEIREASRKRMVNDGESLENFGLLKEVFINYISSSIGQATSRVEAAQKIEMAVDSLLEEVQADTPRGQTILSILIPMLDGYNFTKLAEKYTEQAQSLTCEISPELKQLLSSIDNVKVGNQVPNIVFDHKIKGAKSLYDIDAEKKMIVFWGSWCSHCQQEMPYIKEFYKNFKKEGGEIVAFALDLQEKDYITMVEDAGWINYSDLLKWESPIVKDFAVIATPTIILLDKDNKVVKVGDEISDFIVLEEE